MAISVVGTGSNQVKASGTTLALGSTNIAVQAGDTVIAVIGSDNTAAGTPTVSSVSGGAAGTWSQLTTFNSATATSGGGSRTSVWRLVATGAGNVGSATTVTLSVAVTAKATSFIVFRGVDNTTAPTVTGASATANYSTSAISVPAGGYVIVGGTNELATVPATTIAGTASGTDTLVSLGTTGGTANTNITTSMRARAFATAGSGLAGAVTHTDGAGFWLSLSRAPEQHQVSGTVTGTGAVSGGLLPDPNNVDIYPLSVTKSAGQFTTNVPSGYGLLILSGYGVDENGLPATTVTLGGVTQTPLVSVGGVYNVAYLLTPTAGATTVGITSTGPTYTDYHVWAVSLKAGVAPAVVDWKQATQYGGGVSLVLNTQAKGAVASIVVSDGPIAFVSSPELDTDFETIKSIHHFVGGSRETTTTAANVPFAWTYSGGGEVNADYMFAVSLAHSTGPTQHQVSGTTVATSAVAGTPTKRTSVVGTVTGTGVTASTVTKRSQASGTVVSVSTTPSPSLGIRYPVTSLGAIQAVSNVANGWVDVDSIAPLSEWSFNVGSFNDSGSIVYFFDWIGNKTWRVQNVGHVHSSSYSGAGASVAYDSESTYGGLNDGEVGYTADNQYTVMYWVRAVPLSGGYTYAGVSLGRGVYLQAYPDGGSLKALVSDYFGQQHWGPTLTDGWHHLAMVVDNEAGTIYVDGVAVAWPTIEVGTSTGTELSAYGGTAIDELRYFDVALNEEQINTWKNTTIAGDPYSAPVSGTVEAYGGTSGSLTRTHYIWSPGAEVKRNLFPNPRPEGDTRYFGSTPGAATLSNTVVGSWAVRSTRDFAGNYRLLDTYTGSFVQPGETYSMFWNFRFSEAVSGIYIYWRPNVTSSAGQTVLWSNGSLAANSVYTFTQQFTTPTGTDLSNSGIVLVNNSSTVGSTLDVTRVVVMKRGGSIGQTEWFDGSAADTDQFDYQWVGAERDSASVALEKGQPIVATSRSYGPPPPGTLVAEYGFNEGTGNTTAGSGPGAQTLESSSLAWGTGVYGTAFNDGVDNTNVYGTVIPAAQTALTHMAWVYRRPDGTGGAAWWNDAGIHVDETTIYFRMRQAGADSVSAVFDYTLPTNTWTHIAVTALRERGEAQLYVNGVLTDSKSFPPHAPEEGWGVPDFYFNTESLDDWRIFDGVLTQPEIQSWMGRYVGAPTSATGTVTAVSTVSGSATVSLAVSGTVTGVGTVSGTPTKRTRPTGTVTVLSTVSGTPTKRTAVSGVVSGVSTVAGGALTQKLVLSGTVTAVGTTVGVATKNSLAQGVSAVVSTSSGTASQLAVTTGTAAGVSTVSGVLTSLRQASGSVTGVSTVSGAAKLLGVAAGSVSGVSTTTGSVTTGASSFGVVVGASTVAGSISARRAVSGAVVGVGTVSGSMTTLIPMSGLVESELVVSGDPYKSAYVAPEPVVAVSDTSGDPTKETAVSGLPVDAVSGVSGSFRKIAAGVGTVTVISTVSGTPIKRTSITGTVVGVSATSANPTKRTAVSGVVVGVGTTSGTLSARRPVSGRVDGLSDTSGDLTKVTQMPEVVVEVISEVSGSAVSGNSILAPAITVVSETEGTVISVLPTSGTVDVETTTIGLPTKRTRVSGTVSSVGGMFGGPWLRMQVGVSTVTAVSTVSGTPVKYTAASGTVVGVSTVVGSVGADGTAAGVVTAVSAAWGDIQKRTTGSGVVSAVSTVSGFTRGIFVGRGTVAGVSAVSGAMTSKIQLSGTITGASSVSGNAGYKTSLGGTVVADSEVSGSLTKGAPMAGTVTAIGGSTGTATRQQGLSSAPVAATSTVTGVAVAQLQIGGVVATVSTVSGQPMTGVALSGIVEAISGVSGRVVMVETLYVRMNGTDVQLTLGRLLYKHNGVEYRVGLSRMENGAEVIYWPPG